MMIIIMIIITVIIIAIMWCRGIVVITTSQYHSINPELRFCAGSNLLVACQRFAMERISDSGPGWK